MVAKLKKAEDALARSDAETFRLDSLTDLAAKLG
jgi:hypothetical protein